MLNVTSLTSSQFVRTDRREQFKHTDSRYQKSEYPLSNKEMAKDAALNQAADAIHKRYAQPYHMTLSTKNEQN
jgi:hypothetical protein